MSMRVQHLEGQVAIVTGASRGLGRIYAEKLASQRMTVALLARDRFALDTVSEHIHAVGGNAVVIESDVGDQASIADAFAQVDERLGRVDLLINCAGDTPAVGQAWDIDHAQWWRTMEVHVRGSFLCMQEAMRRMVVSGGGRIVNLASRAGAPRWATVSAYSVAKAAIIKLTENVAEEAREKGICVFAFNPGVVQGVGMLETASHVATEPGTVWADLGDWFRRRGETGHLVSAERGAEIIVALAKGECDFLSGRYLAVGDDFASLRKQARMIENSDVLTMRIREVDWIARKQPAEVSGAGLR
ncbi:SDR family oxidoreductase [Dyella sp. M7H15-1]|uniref:SDR family NAD(P)-dependent oxidoreductase n=1 Tax=Dyella sp. M7H15-1 TaxID=2501295 RepID=UPI001005193A|nr:SDR family oxidoreductase [Dyella sp. M7H15-1]QAU24898.1 SDR family oxidoreductase [Dyella sp. M7H15-1]